jgi:hypothetical protein
MENIDLLSALKNTEHERDVLLEYVQGMFHPIRMLLKRSNPLGSFSISFHILIHDILITVIYYR